MSSPLETSIGLLPRVASSTGAHNQLSTLNGCFVPCLLTILGAVLFLRVGFSVGMMGLWGALGILCFAEFVSYLTVSSFSAIVSNGRTQGGGAYFLIARNLGPAFGGSSGLLFWISYCINATYNVVAWTEIFQSTFISADSWWGRTDNWSQAAISTISYFPLFLVAFKGAGTFAQVNAWIFVGLFLASVVATGSLFLYRDDLNLPGNEGGAWTYTGFNLRTLQDNMWPDPKVSDQCASAAAFGMGKAQDQVCSLQNVFAIIFPAVIGMMEGLNLSGDLKEPERSIPKGTLWAVSVAFALYALLLVGQAGTLSRAALQYDMKAMQHATVGGGYFVVLGVATACLSTVLGSLFGAARILQAMARDEVLPGLSVFKYGTTTGDEPRTAVVASYILGQFFVLLGNLDDISPLLTNFFLMTYVLTDLAAFLLEFSKVPNFRPKFRYYSWQTSLLNCILVLFVMFYLSVIYAVCTLFAVVAIFAFITWRFKGRSDWIDIRQAFLFRFSRRGLQAMSARKDSKYWRPSFLLLAPDMARELPVDASANYRHLIAFFNQIKQKGLIVVGQVLLGEQLTDAIPPVNSPSTSCSSPSPSQLECATDLLSPNQMRQKQLVDSIPDFEGFVQVSVAPQGRLACSNLMLSAGLGSLSTDTVVLALPRSNEVNTMFTDSNQFVDVLSDALHLKQNLIIAANFDTEELPGASIDMWTFGDLHAPPLMFWKSSDVRTATASSPTTIAQMSLLLQVGFLAHGAAARVSPLRSRPSLRLLNASGKDEAESSEALMQSWLLWARIPSAESEVSSVKMPGNEAESPEDINLSAARDLMLKRSCNASLIVAFLPHPSIVGSNATLYVQQLRDLVNGLPRILLVMNGQGAPVITTKM